MGLTELELRQLDVEALHEKDILKLVELLIIASRLVGEYVVYKRHGIAPANESMNPDQDYHDAVQKAKAIRKELYTKLQDPEAHALCIKELKGIIGKK